MISKETLNMYRETGNLNEVYTLLSSECACTCSVMSDSFETPWALARQAPRSIEFPRQESWSELPFPSPGDLSDPGIEPATFAFSVSGGRFFTNTVPPGKVSSSTPMVIPYF